MQSRFHRLLAWLKKDNLRGADFAMFCTLLLGFNFIYELVLIFTLPFPVDPFLQDPNNLPLILLTTVILLPTAAIEELVFRGPLSIVTRKFPHKTWLLVASTIALSLLFGLVHGSPWNMLTQGVTGLSFSIIYLKAGGIHGKFWKPVMISTLAHLGFNTFIVLIMLTSIVLERVAT